MNSNIFQKIGNKVRNPQPLISEIIQQDSEKQKELLTDLREQLTDLLSNKKDLLNLQEQFDKYKMECQEQMKGLEAQNKEYKEEINKLLEEKREAKEDLETMKGQFDSFLIEINKYQEVIKRLENQFQNAKQEKDELEEANKNLRSELNRGRYEQQKADNYRTELESHIGELQSNNAALQQEIMSSKRQKDDADKHGSLVHAQLARILAKPQQPVLSNSDNVWDVVDNDINDLHHLVFQLRNQVKDLDSDAQIYKQNTQKLEQDNAGLRAKIINHNRNISTYDYAVKLLLRGLIPLQHKIKILSAQKQYFLTLENQLNKYKAEMEKLHYKLTGRYPVQRRQPVSLASIGLVALFGVAMAKTMNERNRKFGKPYKIEGSTETIVLSPMTQLNPNASIYRVINEDIHNPTEQWDVEKFIRLALEFKPNFFSLEDEDPYSYQRLGGAQGFANMRSPDEMSQQDEVANVVNSAITRLLSRIHNEEKEKNLLQKSSEDLSNQLRQLAQNKEIKDQEIQSLHRSLSQAQGMIDSLGLENKHLQEQIENLVPIKSLEIEKEKYDDLKSKFNKNLSLLNQKSVLLQNAEKQIQNLQDTIQKLNNDSVHNQQNLIQYENEIDDLTEKCNLLSKQVQTYQKHMRTLKEEIGNSDFFDF
ncbi:structural maintenance of chromosomes protein [Anaeramoeba ignava]|uniref:Structural maintenance of chromosomes protein n=1 Tax=Anaeramoeba ignava TaxID=1746090 RepID=A0A9Q0LZ64_ANAIG|nr:structural maintenance of chromosomes protein [Anaeramoeba ignava]